MRLAALKWVEDALLQAGAEALRPAIELLLELSHELHGPVGARHGLEVESEAARIWGPTSPLGFRVGLDVEGATLLVVAPEEAHAVPLAGRETRGVAVAVRRLLLELGGNTEAASSWSEAARPPEARRPRTRTLVRGGEEELRAVAQWLRSVGGILETLSSDLEATALAFEPGLFRCHVTLRRPPACLIDLGASLLPEEGGPQVVARISGASTGARDRSRKRWALRRASQTPLPRWASWGIGEEFSIFMRLEALADLPVERRALEVLNFFGTATEACLRAARA